MALHYFMAEEDVAARYACSEMPAAYAENEAASMLRCLPRHHSPNSRAADPARLAGSAVTRRCPIPQAQSTRAEEPRNSLNRPSYPRCIGPPLT